MAPVPPAPPEALTRPRKSFLPTMSQSHTSTLSTASPSSPSASSNSSTSSQRGKRVFLITCGDRAGDNRGRGPHGTPQPLGTSPPVSPPRLTAVSCVCPQHDTRAKGSEVPEGSRGARSLWEGGGAVRWHDGTGGGSGTLSLGEGGAGGPAGDAAVPPGCPRGHPVALVAALVAMAAGCCSCLCQLPAGARAHTATRVHTCVNTHTHV